MPHTTASHSNPTRPGQRRAAALLICLLTLAGGCETPASREPTASGPADAAPVAEAAGAPAAPEAPARPDLTPAEAQEVARLLADAERALAEDHLTYPAKGSAWALYDRVRILDPDNDEARRGLERIVERYLDLALDAADRERFSSARAMLDRARLVDPTHPGIAPAAHRVDMLASAKRQVIRLDVQRLRDHDPALAESLRQAGVASRGDGCRAQITAPTDSAGRWIYQQMSEAPGDSRITAQLDIGSPPRIEVLCFPEGP